MIKKITIADIAKKAGVSKSTVSRVLSNTDLVQLETRKKIEKIIEETSYVPNHLAQGLAGSPTKTIGVVIDELSNFFYIEIAEGIDTVLSADEYSMQISSSRWVPGKETQIVRSLISSCVDGILIAPVSPDSEAIDLLKHSRIPFILINCIPKDKTIPFVSCDNLKGGVLAAEHINKQRKKQIIIITGFNHQTMEDRVQGFFSHIQHPENVKRYINIKTQEDGEKLVPQLIENDRIDRIPTALFITNDNVAIGIINKLCDYHIKIPRQVSVVGFDNIQISGICRIPLTTISQSISDMGKIGAAALLEMIRNPENTAHCQTVIEPELILRESSL